MSETIQLPFMLIGIFVMAFGIAAAITLGVVVICRWQKWAPVNTTINIYHLPKEPGDLVGRPVSSDK